MKRKFKSIMAAIALALAVSIPLSITTGCKTPSLETGGVYAPTNSFGEVLYNDIGLVLADSSYKFSYETVLAVFAYERNNRQAIWDISPDVKHALDVLRPKVVAIDRKWVNARLLYKANPTPAGLSVLQTVLAEIQRIVPVIQSQIDPVYSKLITN